MKTSLLAVGLVASASLMGTAHAATRARTPNIDSQTLVATAMPSHSVLSTLDSMLSGTTQTDSDAAQSHNAGAHASMNKPKHHPPLDPTSAPMLGQRRVAAPSSSADPSLPSTAPASNSPSADPTQTLGWQSLLPGSIQ